MPEHQQTQKSTESKSTSQKQATPRIQVPLSNPMAIIQRARINPKSLTHTDVMQLQRTIGNRAVGKLLTEIGLIPSETKQAQPVQMQTIPEEEKEPLQGKIVTPIQLQEIPEEEEPLQTKKENNTRMPDNLKAGVEDLSGIDMSDVRVHYNSEKPAEVGALAYTQGTDIHVAPDQERHLSHEAWHVVQQAQGRVKPTMQLKDGVPVNDDKELEHEADVMGTKAVKMNGGKYNEGTSLVNSIATPNVLLQAAWNHTDKNLLMWDKSINGIKWFYIPSKQKYYYEVEKTEHWYKKSEGKKKNPSDFILEGQNQEYSYSELCKSCAVHVGEIESRVADYDSLAGKEIETDVNADGTYVDETVTDKKFAPKGKKTESETHFYNTYSDRIAIMRENYKDPDIKSFFASDVFFSQFARAFGDKKCSGFLLKLPTTLPRQIKRDTIDNEDTKKTLREIVKKKKLLRPQDEEFMEILYTQNGKTTFNIVNDFNFINRYRGYPAYIIESIEIQYNEELGSRWNIIFNLSQE